MCLLQQQTAVRRDRKNAITAIDVAVPHSCEEAKLWLRKMFAKNMTEMQDCWQDQGSNEPLQHPVITSRFPKLFCANEFS
jgi:hypothetical protein